MFSTCREARWTMTASVIEDVMHSRRPKVSLAQAITASAGAPASVSAASIARRSISLEDSLEDSLGDSPGSAAGAGPVAGWGSPSQVGLASAAFTRSLQLRGLGVHSRGKIREPHALLYRSR